MFTLPDSLIWYLTGFFFFFFLQVWINTPDHGSKTQRTKRLCFISHQRMKRTCPPAEIWQITFGVHTTVRIYLKYGKHYLTVICFHSFLLLSISLLSPKLVQTNSGITADVFFSPVGPQVKSRKFQDYWQEWNTSVWWAILPLLHSALPLQTKNVGIQWSFDVELGVLPLIPASLKPKHLIYALIRLTSACERSSHTMMSSCVR